MENLQTFVDFGNGYIKGLVFLREEEKVTVVAKEIVKTKGMRKGKILDVEDISYCVAKLFEGIKKKVAGDMITSAYVGLSHPDMKISRFSESRRVFNPKITDEDIRSTIKIIEESAKEPNYEIIKIIPVYWLIDDEIKVKDPSGMEARRIKLYADVFQIPKNFLTSLQDIFEKSEIVIDDIVPNILSLPETVLDTDAKDLGTLVVDIGNNQTSYVVYEEGYPIIYGVLPIGGENVTKDISIGLQVDIKEAETIKREKATFGDVEGEDGLDIAFLKNVVEARYEEIFGMINQNLEAIGKSTMLPGGVLLVGGGSLMPGLDTFGKQTFRLASFYAKDKQLYIDGLSSDITILNVIGNYVWVSKFGSQKKGFSFNMGGIGNIFKNLMKFIKNLF